MQVGNQRTRPFRHAARFVLATATIAASVGLSYLFLPAGRTDERLLRAAGLGKEGLHDRSPLAGVRLHSAAFQVRRLTDLALITTDRPLFAGDQLEERSRLQFETLGRDLRPLRGTIALEVVCCSRCGNTETGLWKASAIAHLLASESGIPLQRFVVRSIPLHQDPAETPRELSIAIVRSTEIEGGRLASR